MPPRYRELLDQLRREFPQPVSDPVHDAYVAFSVLRALDRVDALKIAGADSGAAGRARFRRRAGLARGAAGRAAGAGDLGPGQASGRDVHLGASRSQINVISHPSIASIIGVLLASTYNPTWSATKAVAAFRRPKCVPRRWPPNWSATMRQSAGGVFTFGGTGGHAVRRESRAGKGRARLPALRPDAAGRRARAAPIATPARATSRPGWASARTTSCWCPPPNDHSVDLPLSGRGRAAGPARRQTRRGDRRHDGLDRRLRHRRSARIHALRDELVREFSLDYTPHIHADAVIGWAWSVFNDYDFLQNPLGFRGRTVRALGRSASSHSPLGLADSIGIDFHKTGFAPYISSLVIFRDRDDLQYILRPRESLPYLFQSGDHHPGLFTLETSRSATGPMAALANLLLLGKEGLRTLLGHIVEMAEVLREALVAHPDLTVLNDENVGPVTLFRVYPHGTDTFTIKERERSDPKFQEQLAS